jgi:hypothetical protein
MCNHATGQCMCGGGAGGGSGSGGAGGGGGSTSDGGVHTVCGSCVHDMDCHESIGPALVCQQSKCQIPANDAGSCDVSECQMCNHVTGQCMCP